MVSEFQRCLDVAIDAAEKAAEILRSHFAAGVSATEKIEDDKAQGLVTVADLEAEAVIIKAIQDRFPDHAFLAEESAATGDNPDNLWVIDPLDGTNNFAFGIPHFGVSIAYWHRGEPAVGVVLDPLRGELFAAVKDGGATLNGKSISVNSHQAVTETIIATGFYYDRGEMMSQTLRCIETLYREHVQGIRRMGAASLDIAWIANGRYGAFFELTLSPWDYAAAHLILTEAGGKITNCQGRETGLEHTSILATNGNMHQQMIQLLARSA